MNTKDRKTHDAPRNRLARAVTIFALTALCVSVLQAADTLRPEVAKPLLAAQEMIKKGRFKEALAMVDEAGSVTGKTPYEGLTIERMRGAVAQQAGDVAAAVSAYRNVIASGHLAPAEQLQTMEAVAGLEYQLKHYDEAAQWATRYAKAGGMSQQTHTLLLQSFYQLGDCNSIARQLQSSTTPPEAQLQLLLACYQQKQDASGYVSALEKLVIAYPTQTSWAGLLQRIGTKPGFSDRLEIDVHRLQRATGTLTDKSDYLAYGQLALASGLPAEALGVIDQGFAVGVLGRGNGAERDGRLRELARKSAADFALALSQATNQARQEKDGSRLLTLGLNEVMAGHTANGLSLVNEALAKGCMRYADEATLHAGLAYASAGQKVKAVQILTTTRGAGGESDLARLWVAKLQSGGLAG
jgi:tetratricopeptide (TPR) repeat protein